MTEEKIYLPPKIKRETMLFVKCGNCHETFVVPTDAQQDEARCVLCDALNNLSVTFNEREGEK